MELPAKPPSTAAKAQEQPDTLLIMINKGADKEEVATALREAKGNVLSTFGEGEMTTLVVQVEKGKLDETEKKLKGDNKHFSLIQRNPMGDAMLFTNGRPNDPYFSSQWHMAALNATAAWDLSTGSGQILAIADTGSQSTNGDLAGRTYSGLDVVQTGSSGSIDRQTNGSHGTCVATTAAATTNNRLLTASPALGAYIYPIRISYPNGNSFSTDDNKIIQALNFCGNNRIRVLNVSYGYNNTAYSYANANVHPVLHAWMKWYHDQKNGLVIFSAGNSAQYDPSPRQPYLIFVSALSPSYGLASFSNYGQPIWFTAPGVNIACSDRTGRFNWVNGTSFASPLIASLCSMILARNPGMSNRQVEQALINSCRNSTGSKWNTAYGFGLPDAYTALRTYSRSIGDDAELGTGDATPPKPEGPTFELQQPKENEKEQAPDTTPVIEPPPADDAKPTFPPSGDDTKGDATKSDATAK